MTFTLNISIDAASLRRLLANKSDVVIAQPVHSGPSIAWIAFSPMESNTVSWEEAYGLYSSTTSVQAGATVTFGPAMQEGFTPGNTVSIFLWQNVNGGTMIPAIPGKALTVTLTHQHPTANIVYDSANGVFEEKTSTFHSA